MLYLKQYEELDTIIKDVNAYTDNLHKMELHKNTIKETTAAIVSVAVSDSKIVFNQLDNLIDNDILIKYQRLSIPQEQVDLHTLVIGDENEPWKK